MTNDKKKLLINTAHKVRENAYAPYSNFFVGAAVLTGSGTIYSGVNVENSSYGLSVCAERHAIAAAVAAGEKEFLAIAVCSPGGVTPCGACRQVLHDICGNIPVYCVNESGKLKETLTISELLPKAFGDSDLEVK